MCIDHNLEDVTSITDTEYKYVCRYCNHTEQKIKFEDVKIYIDKEIRKAYEIKRFI